MISKILILITLSTVFFVSVMTTIYVSNNNGQELNQVSSKTTLRTSRSQPTPTLTPIPTPTLTPTPSATPTPTPELNLTNKGYKYVRSSIFWVGESADASNAFIANDKSAWDSHWQESFGGIDDPYNRCGYYPCNFTPKENPFYFALPYNDLNRDGLRKANSALVPWFEQKKHQRSIIKNHWVEIRYNTTTCYAQWQDVGPLETDDLEYVFGNQPHKNTFGVAAGIDISPAVASCIGNFNNPMVNWRFVDETAVPDGPWKKIITTSDASWR